jgi:hypothetical protein
VRENHPDLADIFIAPKDIKGYCYPEKRGRFFLIKGFENIPLEKYGHVDSNSDFSQYVKEVYPNHFKKVELNDKITIAEEDIQEEPKKENPTEKNNQKEVKASFPNSNRKTILIGSGVAGVALAAIFGILVWKRMKNKEIKQKIS